MNLLSRITSHCWSRNAPLSSSPRSSTSFARFGRSGTEPTPLGIDRSLRRVAVSCAELAIPGPVLGHAPESGATPNERRSLLVLRVAVGSPLGVARSEEHTSELQSHSDLV